MRIFKSVRISLWIVAAGTILGLVAGMIPEGSHLIIIAWLLGQDLRTIGTEGMSYAEQPLIGLIAVSTSLLGMLLGSMVAAVVGIFHFDIKPPPQKRPILAVIRMLFLGGAIGFIIGVLFEKSPFMRLFTSIFYNPGDYGRFMRPFNGFFISMGILIGVIAGTYIGVRREFLHRRKKCST